MSKEIILLDSEVVVDIEYLALLQSNDKFLMILLGAGVDNWEGFDEARDQASDE